MFRFVHPIRQSITQPRILFLWTAAFAIVFAPAFQAQSLKKEGNVPPKIVKLTSEEESEILKDVKVPDAFDITLFSPSQTANYPVYVAAAPSGDLFVSSDGNGSLGRDPHRGRVLRLRDTDRDGRADEVTEFVKDVDSPRGLIWDHDRLYLLHPPHISVFFDKNGDGVAEDSKRLIDGIAFDFSGRPADHTSNGLEMGIDGWIYIAGGDFGFVKATGTDGRELQHRGGGVIRFRPDGSGLELFSTGTRNILGTPMSPLLDMFARDNTNDGGGWDVRLHHFAGLEDHGYPRLYKNFGDEHVHPLADYGGGSGCGSVYIHEPGFPNEWKNAPFTCDWGRNASFHHSVKRAGATFEETTEPRAFVRMTRPTDADVDGMSAVYQASWKGATFKWEGPDVGYIVRVTPKGYTPEPLPDFESLSDAELVAALESPSHIRTLAAQRTLLRRDENENTSKALVGLAANTDKPIEARVAALFAVSQRGIPSSNSLETLGKIIPLANIDGIASFVVRACGDMSLDSIGKGKAGPVTAELFRAGMESEDPRRQLEAIIAATRQNMHEVANDIAAHLGHADPRIAHTAYRALAKLHAHETAFAALDNGDSAKRRGAAFALMRMHLSEVVDGLIQRLETENRLENRKSILSVLSRLYHREGKWNGNSWGTRPDTRGPYYQPETWDQSNRVLAALKTTIDDAPADEAAFLVKEMSRNRIVSGAALNRMLSLTKNNPGLIPDAVKQLVKAETVPREGAELLIRTVNNDSSETEVIADSILALSRIDGGAALEACLTGFSRIDSRLDSLRAELKTNGKIDNPVKAKSEKKYLRTKLGEAERHLRTAASGFLRSPRLENHHLLLEKNAAIKSLSPRVFWANAGVLALASRKDGSPESRELSQRAIDAAWQDPARRITLMKVAALTRNHYLDDRIRITLNHPDKLLRSAARAAAKSLKLKAVDADKTPKIGTLDPKKALTTVIKHKGDTALGEAVFTRATCTACHTTNQDQPPKGPYLGNIVETYKRPELAESILDPNKTVAQGFATNIVTLKNGESQVGFVTDEQGDEVTLRDITARKHTFKKADISTRTTSPVSMMPPALMNDFTVHEMASLLDYLESLAGDKPKK